MLPSFSLLVFTFNDGEIGCQSNVEMNEVMKVAPHWVSRLTQAITVSTGKLNKPHLPQQGTYKQT
jgi:hypothetical protein